MRGAGSLRRGEFDYIDAIGEVSEADLFRLITEHRFILGTAPCRSASLEEKELSSNRCAARPCLRPSVTG